MKLTKVLAMMCSVPLSIQAMNCGHNHRDITMVRTHIEKVYDEIAFEGNKQEIQTLLEQPNLSYIQPNPTRMLFHFLKGAMTSHSVENEEIVDLLIKYKADPNRTIDKFSSLGLATSIAIGQGCKHLLNLLLPRPESNPFKAFQVGEMSPYSFASTLQQAPEAPIRPKAEQIVALFEPKATNLCRAVLIGSLAKVDEYLNPEAVNEYDEEGDLPVFNAIRLHKDKKEVALTILTKLLKAGGKPNQFVKSSPMASFSAMDLATSRAMEEGDTSYLEKLLEHGGDPNLHIANSRLSISPVQSALAVYKETGSPKAKKVLDLLGRYR